MKSDHLDTGGETIDRDRYFIIEQKRCLSLDCGNLTTKLYIYAAKYGNDGNPTAGKHLKNYNIEPNSSAKIFHANIPVAIIQDYEEACVIVDLSPKASATLARRCLQGMISHSCEITKGTLAHQIGKLREKVQSGEMGVRHVDVLSLDAIDALRAVGNIGAHMERDIDIIVDVEPDEARLLIGLIETLLDSWYVERQRREASFAKITELAAAKEAQRKPATIETMTLAALPKPD